MNSRRANTYASRFYGNVIAALVLYFLLFPEACSAYDSFCENLGSVCRSECAGVRDSYNYCERNDDWCQQDRAISDQQAHDACIDACMDRRQSTCDRRGVLSPTLKERRTMAKQKKDRAKEQRVAVEKLNKKVVSQNREIVKQTTEIAELDAIVVVEQGNIELVVNVLRNRQFHVKDDLTSIVAEVNRVHGPGIWPELTAIIDALEAECDSVLTSYPEGWPN